MLNWHDIILGATSNLLATGIIYFGLRPILKATLKRFDINLIERDLIMLSTFLSLFLGTFFVSVALAYLQYR